MSNNKRKQHSPDPLNKDSHGSSLNNFFSEIEEKVRKFKRKKEKKRQAEETPREEEQHILEATSETDIVDNEETINDTQIDDREWKDIGIEENRDKRRKEYERRRIADKVRQAAFYNQTFIKINTKFILSIKIM